jgi:uncharacterized membrane protein
MSKNRAPTASNGNSPRVGVFYPLMALVSLIGLFDSLYLTVHHLRGDKLQCTITGGCEEVLNSAYATIGPVPLAALGAAAYFTVFCLALLVCFGYARLRSHLLGLVVLMSLMTGYLLYVQGFVLKHFCQYCLLSAAVTISLLLLVIGARIRAKWQGPV